MPAISQAPYIRVPDEGPFLEPVSPPCNLSPVESKVDTIAKKGFNHNFFAGLIYVANGLTGIASIVPSAAINAMKLILTLQERLGDAADIAIDSAEEVAEIPDSLGLRRYLSVLTGVSNMIESLSMFKESTHENYRWGRIDAGIKMMRGLSEAGSGIISGTLKAINIWANSGINQISMQMASVASDVLSSAQMVLIAMPAAYGAYKAGALRRKITQVPSHCSLIDKIQSLRQRKLTKAPNPSVIDLRERQIRILKSLLTDNLKREDKLLFKKTIGEQLYNKLKQELINFDNSDIEYLNFAPLYNVIDEVTRKLQKHEISYAILSAVCFASAILNVVGDFITAGLVSDVIAILKPIIALAVYHYDIIQFRQGLADDKEESKISVIMRYILAAVCIGIAAATFLSASTLSGGAIPITLLVIGVTMPLVSLYVSHHKQQIKSATRKIASVFSKSCLKVIEESKATKLRALSALTLPSNQGFKLKIA